jgi:uncharacterized protein with PQ loop repeat
MWFCIAFISGWIGAILFALCGIPQAWKVYRTKKCRDISLIFLLMWFIAEILTIIYILYDNTINGKYQLPLLVNYIFNIVIVGYLLVVKLRSLR